MKPIFSRLLIAGLASGCIFLLFRLNERDAIALSVEGEFSVEIASLSECRRQHRPEERMSRDLLTDILNHSGGFQPDSWILANPVPVGLLGFRFANLSNGRYRLFLGHGYPDLAIVLLTVQNSRLTALEIRSCYQQG